MFGVDVTVKVIFSPSLPCASAIDKAVSVGAGVPAGVSPSLPPPELPPQANKVRVVRNNNARFNNFGYHFYI